MPALVEYSVAKKLSNARAGVPSMGGHPMDDDLLALRLDVGHPAGQGVENGFVVAGVAVASDPEHAVVGVGQSWGEVHLRVREVGKSVAGVPMIL